MHVDDRILIVWSLATAPWNWTKKYFTVKDKKNKIVDTCPRVDTVLTSLICLIAFLITAILATIFPTVTWKRTTVGVNSFLALALGLVLVFDIWTRV